MLIDLYNACHEGIPGAYDEKKRHRVGSGGRHYWHLIFLDDGDTRHGFPVEVDDSTSPDHLIVVSVSHIVR
jgi:hypothetical protein